MNSSVENRISKALSDNRHRFASMEHARWAHWQSYLHSKCKRMSDGSLLIPPELVERWERQIHTSFDDLSIEERASDLEQVASFIQLVETIVSEELK